MKDARQKEILRYMAINMQDDAELQEIVALASAVCQSPVALITLFDDDAWHLKVNFGFKGDGTAYHGFCSHAILKKDIMIVPDSQKDERFEDLVFDVADQPVRFYAGAPLITGSGLVIGSLCVLDNKPRTVNHNQVMLLQTLARQVVKTLELTVRVIELEQTEKEVEEQRRIIKESSIKLRSFFESSANFHVLLGKGGEVLDFNKTAYRFVKNVHKTKMKRGDLLLQFIAPSFVSTFIDKYHQALEGKKSVEEGSTDYGELGIIWWEAFFDPARNDEEEIIGVSYLIRDVSERKLKEMKIVDQNESLLKIAHIQAHEFRGPLTTIMGLMNLIKEENYIAPVSYLQFLEQAVENLDDKIKKIVISIEDGVIK